MKKIKLFDAFNEAEDHANLGVIHKDAGTKRVQDWQKANKDTKVNVGDWVKMAFVDGKETEWMWVKIDKVVDKDTFKGTVDNEPIAVNNIKIGDKVDVSRGQIAQHMGES